MCEICGGTNGNHDPRCPNADDPKVVGECECCGYEIHEKESHYKIDDRIYLCKRCVDDDGVSKRELLDAAFELELK